MRPLFWAGLGSVAGVLLALVGVYSAAFLVAIAVFLLLVPRLPFLIFGVSCAIFCLNASLRLPEPPPRHIFFKYLCVTGRVVSSTPFSGGMQVLVIRGSIPDGTPITARLFCHTHSSFLCGTVIRAHGSLTPVQRETSAWWCGVEASLAAGDVAVVDYAPSLWNTVSNIRNVLADEVVKVLPYRTRPFMRALIFGQRTALNTRQLSIFSHTGTAHFLAISGIHIAMLVALAFWLLRRFILLRTRVLITLLLCFVYLLVSGAPVTLLRSLTIAFVLLFGLFLGRRGDLLNTVGAAAALVLALNPAQLFLPGFHLSFVTFTAVAVSYPLFYRLFLQKHRLVLALKGYPPGYEPPLETARRRLHEVVFFSAVASLASAPLLAFHFGSIPLIAVVANALLFPLFYLALAFGFVTLFLFPFGVSCVSGVLFACVSEVIFRLGGALDDVALLLRIPSRSVPPLTLPALLAFYAAFFLTVMRLRGKFSFLNTPKILCLWLVAGVVWLGLPHLRRPPSPQVRIIRTGSSRTLLIRTPDDFSILYGLRLHREAELHRLVMRLYGLGVDRIDALILSVDRPPPSLQTKPHRSLLTEFLRRMRVDVVLIPAAAEDDPWTTIIRTICAQEGVCVCRTNAGDCVGRFVRVLGPPKRLFGEVISRGQRAPLLFVDIGGGVFVGDGRNDAAVAAALLSDTPSADVAFITKSPSKLFLNLLKKTKKVFFAGRPTAVGCSQTTSALLDEAVYP